MAPSHQRDFEAPEPVFLSDRLEVLVEDHPWLLVVVPVAVMLSAIAVKKLMTVVAEHGWVGMRSNVLGALEFVILVAVVMLLTNSSPTFS